MIFSKLDDKQKQFASYLYRIRHISELVFIEKIKSFFHPIYVFMPDAIIIGAKQNMFSWNIKGCKLKGKGLKFMFKLHL